MFFCKIVVYPLKSCILAFHVSFRGKKTWLNHMSQKQKVWKKHVIGNLKTQTFVIKHIKIKTYWKDAHHGLSPISTKKKVSNATSSSENMWRRPEFPNCRVQTIKDWQRRCLFSPKVDWRLGFRVIDFKSHRIHWWYIYTCIWLICMVNGGKYTIHWRYGIVTFP